MAHYVGKKNEHKESGKEKVTLQLQGINFKIQEAFYNTEIILAIKTNQK